jgi:ribonuclease Z
LSLLDAEVFKVPRQKPTQEAGPVAADHHMAASLSSVAEAHHGHYIRMHPAAPPVVQAPGPNNPAFPSAKDLPAAVERISGQMPRYLGLVADAQRRVREEQASKDRSSVDSARKTFGINVTPLGTGSAIPSKYRNGKDSRFSVTLIKGLTTLLPAISVSSTLVDVPGFGSIMLDAGEGTLGQLRRCSGDKIDSEVYQKLRILFISHMHADHHIGVRRILEDRMKVS